MPKGFPKNGINIRKGRKRLYYRDENNPNWKGDDADYYNKHEWVIVRLGRPTTCERCGKTGLTGHKIHWANKSRTYKRELSDWMRLCASCHRVYDSKPRKGKKYKGISCAKGDRKWIASFRGKRIGSFKTEDEAAIAYNETAFRLYGDFVTLNKLK